MPRSQADAFSGLFGWFGEVNAAAPEHAVAAMGRSFGLADPTAGFTSLAATIQPVSPSSAGVAASGPVIAVIDGHPEWSHGDIAAIARDRGHGEALIEAYRRFDEKLLEHVHGPFVLAVFDRDQRAGLTAIDRLGIHSLSYAAIGDKGVAFGSRCGAVAALPAVDAAVSPQAVYDYLLFYRVPAPDTIYAGVRKLLPAQFLRFERGAVRAGFYWQMPYEEGWSAEFRDMDALKQALMARLEAGVRTAARDEPPERVGAFLSGGLDSSTVAGMLARVQGGSEVKAFTIGFDTEGYDETEYAAAAAAHFGMQHIVYRLKPDDLCDAIPHISSAFDEPYGNSSCVPTYYCARLARDHGVDVLLAGDGGDELFAGNDWYSRLMLFEAYQHIPAALRRYAIEPLVFGIPGGDRFVLTRKARSYIEQARVPMPERGFNPEAGLVANALDMLVPEITRQIDPDNPLKIMREVFHRTRSRALIQRMMHHDLQVILADNDLRKVGRMCAQAGVRVRFPLLDEGVVDVAAKVPARLQLRGSEARYFYRRALSEFLPRKVIEKRKHGFGLPFADCLRQSSKLQEVVYGALEASKRRGIVREDYVDQMVMAQRTNDHHSYAGPLWDLMVLELWMQHHVDAAPTRVPEPA